MELSSDFKTYLSSIEPDPDAVTAAKDAHEKVREQLRTDAESKDAHKDTFLSGSYARDTAIHDINDVDVICVVDIDRTITEPDAVLAWIKGILDRYYKETRLQGRSVGAKATKGVWLDIVPGTPAGADDGPLWIPDRDAKAWVETHPKGQIKAEVDKNKATDGYYIHVVKLMKAWRDRLPRESGKLKSYILETLVHGSIGYPKSHAAGIVASLEGIENKYGAYRKTGVVPVLTDPGYSSVNVAKRWGSKDFDDFMDQVKSSSATARQALDSSNLTDSLRLWRKLFGDQFGK